MKRLAIIVAALLCMGQQQNCNEECGCGKFKSIDASAPGLITYVCDCEAQPTPTPTASPTPAPRPTPSPTPSPTPESTPSPTPDPTPPACPGIGVKIDATCAGATPYCGIQDTKNPRVRAGVSNVVLDATYYQYQPWQEVHHRHECYPGPIVSWSPVDEVNCSACRSNCHLITCYDFTDPGSYTWTVTGANGSQDTIIVSVR